MGDLMRKFQSVFVMILLLFICFEVLIDSESILKSVIFSLNLFKNNIFPSLFPFFVLSSLLIKYGLPEFMSNIFGGVMGRLFKISGKCSFIFFMSVLSGNPACAKFTRELYLNGSINKYEATKILCFCAFTSPLFILGGLSVLLNNSEVPILILICHYFGNIMVGILIRNYHPSKNIGRFNIKKAINEMHLKRISNDESFGFIITNSLVESINTLLLILGVITMCLVITTIISNNLSLNSTFQSVLNGFIEMTQGIKYISLEAIPLRLKCVLSVMILSFGGLSVHMQIMSVLSDTDIRYLPFLASRVLASIISSLSLFFVFDYFI